jgi:hypothetical protein
MTDIFISYSREDEQRVKILASALEKYGWSVFWDRIIPAGQTWREYIGKALAEAKCIIVAWSETSVHSNWVIEEADEGKNRGLLVPVLLDQVKQPLGFGELHAADLTDWKYKSPSDQFDLLVKEIRKRIEKGEETPGSQFQPGAGSKNDDRKATDLRKKQKRKYLIIAAGVTVAVTIALILYFSLRSGPQPGPGPDDSLREYPEQGGAILVNCSPNPYSIPSGGQVEISIQAFTEQHLPVSGATVQISAGGGWFSTSGTGTEIGQTDSQGVFRTTWRSPHPAASGYGMGATVSKEGFTEGKCDFKVNIK